MKTSDDTVALMIRALRLASCWCTNVVWYSKLAANKCTVCQAIEAYDREHSDLTESKETATL